jgi:hypothetical protein
MIQYEQSLEHAGLELDVLVTSALFSSPAVRLAFVRTSVLVKNQSLSLCKSLLNGRMKDAKNPATRYRDREVEWPPMNLKSELIHMQNVATLSACKPLLSIHLWYIQGATLDRQRSRAYRDRRPSVP